MNRVALIFTVGLGLAVATFAGLWSSHNASAQQLESADLKCYRVQRTQPIETGSRLIYISDQFEEKNLVIKKPITFCSLAEKGGFGGTTAGLPNEPSDLVCYSFTDAPHQQRFRGAELLTIDQFTENFLQITKPYSLCEPAEKSVVNLGSGAGFDHAFFDAFEFKCYRVRRLENGDRFPKIDVRVSDQFDAGGKDVRLGAPVLFCTQVIEKKNKAKNDHIEHAAVLESPDEYHASTISTGSDRSDPRMSCVSSYGHSVYFTYTPIATGSHTFDTSLSTYDTVMTIYEAGDPLQELACDDDSGLDEGSSLIETSLQGGHKYIIVVGARKGTPGGKLKLNVDEPFICSAGSPSAAICGAGTTAAEAAGVGEAAPITPYSLTLNYVCYAMSQRAPANGLLETGDQLGINAIQLGRGNMFCTPAEKKTFAETDDIRNAGTLYPFNEVSVVTTEATSSPSDPSIYPDCDVEFYSHSVWYSFAFDGNSKEFLLDTLGSSYDTVIGVFKGTPGNLELVGCDDDGGPDHTSSLEIETKDGPQKYYIVVGSYEDTDGGKLKLHLDTTAGSALSVSGAS